MAAPQKSLKRDSAPPRRTVLITGANKGIGFEIARQCGRAGLHVIISGRDEERVSKALAKLRKEEINAEALLMDVSKQESIEEAVGKFAALNLRLDALVNNAAIAVKGDKSISQADENILLETLRTNSFGPVRVTKAFLPYIKSPGRIVMMSSGAGSMAEEVKTWSPAYGVSKTLLNALTRHLAHELEKKSIAVNAVCPGWVRTDMGGMIASRSVSKGAETPAWLICEAPQALTGKIFRDKQEIPW